LGGALVFAIVSYFGLYIESAHGAAQEPAFAEMDGPHQTLVSLGKSGQI
jgi:hypothetical protein